MKKLILSSVMLFILSVSIAFIQVGCQKVEASPSAQSQLTASPEVILLYVGANLITMDYNGNNQKSVNLKLPSNENIVKTSFRLSEDGTKIFFATNVNLYSCNLDGSSLTPIQPVVTTVTMLDVK